MKTEKIPRDRYYLVYIVFYLMGVGNLMPWNFFINGKLTKNITYKCNCYNVFISQEKTYYSIILFWTVQSYWDYKFRDVGDDNHPNGSHASTFVQLAEDNDYQNFSMLLDTEQKRTELQLSFNSYLSMTNMIPNLMMLFVNAIIGHKFPMRPRLFVSLVGICILFIFSDVMTQINTDTYQFGFLGLTLASVVLITMLLITLMVKIE